MRKWLSALMCAVLLLSLSACSIGDVAYYRGMWHLRQGDYTAAYEWLRTATTPAAAEQLDRFAFVPLTHTLISPYSNRTTTYTYDEAGYPATVETVQGKTTYLHTYVYVNGVQREHRTTEVYGNGNTAFSRHTYTEQGEPLYRAYYESDVLQSEEQYVYDGQGNLLKRTESSAAIGEGYYNCEEYTYDRQGRTLTASTVYKDTYEQSERKSTYVYAEDGSYVKHTHSDNGDGKWRSQSNFDAEGRLVRSYETLMGEVGDDKTRLFECRYDAAGNEVYRYSKWYDTVETTTAEYNKRNQLVYRKTLDEDGNIREIVKCTYNDAGDILTRAYTNTGFSWYKDSYTYDAEGKLLTERHTGADMSYTRTATYTYNEDGTLKMSEEQDSYGAIYNAYGYDEWGNRVQSLSQYDRQETKAFATWELHYYPDGVPEDVEDVINDLVWD